MQNNSSCFQVNQKLSEGGSQSQYSPNQNRKPTQSQFQMQTEKINHSIDIDSEPESSVSDKLGQSQISQNDSYDRPLLTSTTKHKSGKSLDYQPRQQSSTYKGTNHNSPINISIDKYRPNSNSEEVQLSLSTQNSPPLKPFRKFSHNTHRNDTMSVEIIQKIESEKRNNQQDIIQEFRKNILLIDEKGIILDNKHSVIPITITMNQKQMVSPNNNIIKSNMSSFSTIPQIQLMRNNNGNTQNDNFLSEKNEEFSIQNLENKYLRNFSTSIKQFGLILAEYQIWETEIQQSIDEKFYKMTEQQKIKFYLEYYLPSMDSQNKQIDKEEEQL